MKKEAVALMLEIQTKLEALDPQDSHTICAEFYTTFCVQETRVLPLDTTRVLNGGHVAQGVLGTTGVQRGSSSPRSKNLQLQAKALEVLGFLNQKTGKSYRPVEENLRFIRARLATASVEDCKGVIARKTRVWMGTEQGVYLRPKTLFNATNFEQYLGEQGS